MCKNCDALTIPTGVPGEDGENAYTVLTASYVQPAVNTNVTITVSNTGQYSTGWCAIGQLIYVAFGGYYEVVSKTTTTITIKYTSDYTTYNQSLTAVAGTVPNSGVVSPGGIIGLTGSSGSNGTTILSAYNSLTGITSSTVETTFFTYTLPANTLNSNGDEIELYAYYEYFQNDILSLRIKLGSKIVTLSIGDVEDDIRILKIKISRISATSQLWTIEERGKQSTGVFFDSFLQTDSSTVDLTTILTFAVTGQDLAFGATSVTFKKGVLYKYAV